MKETIKYPKILIIGHAMVDVSIGETADESKLRMGGIFHAARGLWAIDCPFSLAYFAPDYLDEKIQEFAIEHKANSCIKIGSVSGAPNIHVIKNIKEAGRQSYEFILKNEHKSILDNDKLKEVIDGTWDKILVFPGGFDLSQIFESLSGSPAEIYFDINYAPKKLAEFEKLGRPVDGIILSTSSELFIKDAGGDISKIIEQVRQINGKSLIFKENRGGTRYFYGENLDDCIQIPSHTKNIEHSIGVGDCFNAVFMAMKNTFGNRTALSFASLIASEYASTTYPDNFKEAVQGWLKVPKSEVADMQGVCLPWEKRKEYNIYIAAPDFDYIDKRPIDKLADSLKYHNFSPRLPIRENGSVQDQDPLDKKYSVCHADVELIYNCQMLIAVLLFNDPGTLIEIGMAIERGIPVFVYDPYNIAKNLFLTVLPKLVSADIDDIICQVFLTFNNLDK